MKAKLIETDEKSFAFKKTNADLERSWVKLLVYDILKLQAQYTGVHWYN